MRLSHVKLFMVYLGYMKRILFIILIASLLLFSCSVQITPEQPPEITNCILIIGDGMGFAHVKAASLYLTGEEDGLSFQQFPGSFAGRNPLSLWSYH